MFYSRNSQDENANLRNFQIFITKIDGVEEFELFIFSADSFGDATANAVVIHILQTCISIHAEVKS